MKDSAAFSQLKVKDQILHLLKRQGPQSAAAIAQALGVSPMAIRQHLQDLQAEAWVIYGEERRPVGRPVKLWRLTQTAMELFPDHHADLLVNILQGVQQVFGEQGLQTLIADRARHQLQTYSDQLPQEGNWQDRVIALAELRSREGYMAEAIQESDTSMLLVENHCSICAAAQTCQQLCSAELEVFTQLLGDAVQVERVEHIVSGDRRCAYRVSSSDAFVNVK
jgi:iron-sulfur cluster biosynthesis transcriptional regulator SufR